MRTALVVAAHPDDEVLGCGGTISRLHSEGCQVHVLILAEGATSRGLERNVSEYHSELNDLARSAERANRILGTTSINLHSLPDNRMDGLELLDVVKIVEEAIVRLKPNLVMTHHAGDVNVDHRVIHDAVITACRPQPDCPVRTLLFFEVPSSTEWRPLGSGIPFEPNCFYDVTEHLETKLKALQEYASEMRCFPHPRSLESVEHLARWRGSIVGCNAAEAFMLGRNII